MTTTCLIILIEATHEPGSNNTSHLNWRVQEELYYTCSYKTHWVHITDRETCRSRLKLNATIFFAPSLYKTVRRILEDNALGLLKRTKMTLSHRKLNQKTKICKGMKANLCPDDTDTVTETPCYHQLFWNSSKYLLWFGQLFRKPVLLITVQDLKTLSSVRWWLFFLFPPCSNIACRQSCFWKINGMYLITEELSK